MSSFLDEPLAPVAASKDELLERAILGCAKLEAALLSEDEDLPQLMQQIQSQLGQYPELVHLLSDEQIAPLYIALRTQSQIEIKVSKSKTKKSAGLLENGQSLKDVL